MQCSEFLRLLLVEYLRFFGALSSNLSILSIIALLFSSFSLLYRDAALDVSLPSNSKDLDLELIHLV